MTAKLLQISSYTRRTPVDRYASIREAKTAQLEREMAELKRAETDPLGYLLDRAMNDHIGAMLCDALELMDLSDIREAR